jgi:hypothetical protein
VLQQDGTWLVNIDGVFYSAQAQRTEMWADNREYYILESGDDSFAVPVDSGWHYNVIDGQWQPVSILSH